MWDLIILTARNVEQRRAFQDQLAAIGFASEYGKKVIVIADRGDRRIGSGGSTIQIIKDLEKSYGERKLRSMKVLLMHSGGVSQRMAHVSAYGKAFLMTPGGSVLEMKLRHYQKYLEKLLPHGLMITASDVLEDMSSLVSNITPVDLIAFAHLSTIKVGTQHGVFVVDDKRNLKSVLQKPTVQEMIEKKCANSDGHVLTDSCYWMSWEICHKLISDSIWNTPINEELCCYGDFMRPMGYIPLIEYISTSAPPRLALYRRALANVFSTARVSIRNLGINSFFHLGTYEEFLEHITPGSKFTEKFISDCDGNVVNCIGNIETVNKSFVEYSRFNCDVIRIGTNSLISGVDVNDTALNQLPQNVVIFTLALKNSNYVTIIINIDSDLKANQAEIKWNQHNTGITNMTLWNSRLFKKYSTRYQSFKGTLDEWMNGIGQNEGRLSIEDAVNNHDIDVDLKWRASLA